MEFDSNRIQSLLTYRYDPGTTSPDPTYRHLQEYRDKEFDDGTLAERFHENTKFTEHDRRVDRSTIDLFVTDETMQLVQAQGHNDYPGRETVSLPEPERELNVDLGTVLSRRRSRRRYDGTPISLQHLSTLLGLGLGVNGEIPTDGGRKQVRTYPSGGGLFPVEPYVAVINGGEELDDGLYYYVPEEHVLRRLDGDVTEEIGDAFVAGAGLKPRDSALCLLFTGAFWRSYAKYGSRGYRFVLQETGHMCQNVQLVADALGFGSVPYGAVKDDEVDRLLGLNGVDESLVYAMFVGTPERRPGGAGGSDRAAAEGGDYGG